LTHAEKKLPLVLGPTQPIASNITDDDFVLVKAKFHYAIWFEPGSKLVADLQLAGVSFSLSSSLLAAN